MTVRKPKTKKRKKLGEGFIWFAQCIPGSGYTHVSLSEKAHGQGEIKTIKIGNLGGWQKVKLYAEYSG